MILLSDLTEYFNTTNSKTFNKFLKNAFVILHDGSRVHLYDYVNNKNIDLDDIQNLYFHIKTREKYLTSFYNVSLKLPENVSIEEEPMRKKSLNNNKLVKYKNVIRNMFFWEIMKNTKSGLGFPTYVDVLNDLYNNECIDYRLLAPSSLFYLREGRIGSVFSSIYFRASIMNPYLVYSLNLSSLKGKRIFTPTMGWGSYFYGFAESGIENYVGIDVIPSVCKKMKQFANKQYPQINSEFICCPSENLLNDNDFMKRTKEQFDVVFFSPPYFKMELYEGKMQSTTKYPDYETWLREYWEKTVVLCNHVLIHGGLMCYILSDYGSQPKGKLKKFNLLNDMNFITEQHFVKKWKVPMFNKNVHVTTHDETAEQIMCFVKQL